jgi:hypothetical protein
MLDFRFSQRRVWRWQLSGIQSHVVSLKHTDFSGVRTASIFRADESSTHLWNVGLLQRYYTALYPRKLSSLILYCILMRQKYELLLIQVITFRNNSRLRAEKQRRHFFKSSLTRLTYLLTYLLTDVSRLNTVLFIFLQTYCPSSNLGNTNR